MYIGNKTSIAWRFFLMLAVAGVLFAGGLYRIDSVSREAVVCETVCRQLLENTTAGRQALISSVWWPPLPFLLRFPFAAVMRTETCPVSSLLVSALFGAGVLLLLDVVLRDWKLGWSRFLMVLALAANPFFLKACFNGSSGTTVIFLAMLTSYSLVQWIALRELKYLVYLGFGAALLEVTSLEMGMWLLMIFLLLIVDQAVCPLSRRQKEGVLILTLLPPAYTAGLWILTNWLIMGDGFYFVRSVLSPGCEPQVLCAKPVIISDLHYIAAGIALLVVAMSVLNRNRAGVCLGTLGITLLVLAWFLAARGFPWDPILVLFCLFPFCIMAVGYTGVLNLITGRARIVASLIPLVISVSAIMQLYPVGVETVEPGEYGAITAERNTWLPQIERHVLSRSRYVKVFICGYDGFLLVGDAPAKPTFVQMLDFNFNKVKDEYWGQTLYVLVHRPIGRSAMDSIHWKYDRIFTLGSHSTLYDSDWGDWRLFEIIQAPRRIEKRRSFDTLLRKKRNDEG